MNQDNTLTSPLPTTAGDGRPLLGVTILWHPELERVGSQFIAPATTCQLEVSRYAPLFFQRGQEGEPLGHRTIARSPLRLDRCGDDSVEVGMPDSRMVVELNGAPLEGRAVLSREQVARGVVLGLGGHVLLCLHWMSSLPNLHHVDGLVGVGSAAADLRAQLRQVAATDLPVLLLGETGSGKDVAARAIHALSRRRDTPLVAVNMATLSESLAAADLFGAVRGAYTGAQASRRGLFAEADGATLFLDEIGDTPAAVQPMLLRVLESGAYRPLGASQDARSSARLIAATDQDLAARGFNLALLNRMQSFVIRVPPLRERREDLGLLLLHFQGEDPEAAGEPLTLPFGLVSEFCNCDWPGNVRQLANVTRRALMALRAGQHPRLSDFVAAPGAPAAAASATFAAEPPVASASRSKPSEVSDRDLLAAMEANRWQISGAAQQLGISRPSLYKLLDAHPLIRPAALIPAEELRAALLTNDGNVEACAAQLKTPSEALRRHLRVLASQREAGYAGSPGR